MPDLAEAIRREAKEAKRDPSALAMFKSLRLNLGTADVRREYLIGPDAWQAAKADVPRDGELISGLDLGSGASMSAIAACWAGTGRLEIMAAFPSTPTLAERGLRDGVGRLYLNLLDTGDLLTLGENVVPIPDLLQAAYVRFGVPSTIVWASVPLTYGSAAPIFI